VLAYLHKAPHLIDLKNIMRGGGSSSVGMLCGSDVSVVVAPVRQQIVDEHCSFLDGDRLMMT